MSLSYSLTVSVSLKVGMMFLSLLVREASFWLIIVHNGSQVSFHCFARSPGHAHEDSGAPSLMSNVSCWVSTSSSQYCATISWFIIFKQGIMGGFMTVLIPTSLFDSKTSYLCHEYTGEHLSHTEPLLVKQTWTPFLFPRKHSEMCNGGGTLVIYP